MSDSTSPMARAPYGRQNTNLQQLLERLYYLGCAGGLIGEIQRTFNVLGNNLPSQAANPSMVENADALVDVLREATETAEQVASALRLRAIERKQDR